MWFIDKLIAISDELQVKMSKMCEIDTRPIYSLGCPLNGGEY